MKKIKSRLQLSEYGRNVQEMVNYLKTIEDRDLRNQQARIVVAIMGNIYPQKRDSDEFQNMLWDHLYMIADFELDIDSPYPMPTEDILVPKPDRLPYTQTYFEHRQYGVFVQQMVREVANDTQSTPEEKDVTMLHIAKFMRQQAYNFNNEYPSNEVIASDINEICGDAYHFSAELLDTTKVDKPQHQHSKNRGQRRQTQVQHRKNKRK